MILSWLAACSSSPSPQALPPLPHEVVVVATADLDPGTAIDAAHAELQKVPVGAARGAQTALGGKVLHRVMAGEPVHRSRIGAAPPSHRVSVPAESLFGVEVDTHVRLVVDGELGEPTRVLQVDPGGFLELEGAKGASAGLPLLVNPIDVSRREVHGSLSLHERWPKELEEPRHGWVGIALRDLHPGVVITEEDVAPRDLPIEGAFPVEFLVGSRPSQPILAGEIVRDARIADPTKPRGLHAILPRSMVSVAVRGPEATPGSYVDVLSGEVELQIVFVLGWSDGVLALLLTPEQATRLAMAPETANGVRTMPRDEGDLTPREFR